MYEGNQLMKTELETGVMMNTSADEFVWNANSCMK